MTPTKHIIRRVAPFISKDVAFDENDCFMPNDLHMPTEDNTPLDIVHFDSEDMPSHVSETRSSSSAIFGEIPHTDESSTSKISVQKSVNENQPIVYERRRIKFADQSQPAAANQPLPRWACATIQDAQNQPVLGNTRFSIRQA